MAKNKTDKQKKKSSSMSRVVGSNSKVNKSKNKTKAVSTNLKRINLQTKSKTASVDKEFDSLRRAGELKKAPQQTKEKSSNAVQTRKVDKKPPPDMNAAADAFANL